MDAVDPAASAFWLLGQHAVSAWAPVMIVNHAILKWLIYVSVCRHATGIWTITCRTFADEPHSNDVIVKLTVLSHDKGNRQKHIYIGKVVSNMAANSEIAVMGSSLSLSDRQVMELRTGFSLFDYTVELSVHPHSCVEGDRNPQFIGTSPFVCDREGMHMTNCPKFKAIQTG